MWDLWLVKLSNVITIGNIGAVATLIGCFIYFYYKIRRYIALQHYQYLEYLKELEMQHKKEIKAVSDNLSTSKGETNNPQDNNDNQNKDYQNEPS